MTNNLSFNKTPGRERVKVLHISSHLGCSQYCRAIYFKASKDYANTRQEKNEQKTGGQKLKDPAVDQA